jgi:SAM-dependent methyltransferase
MSERSPFPSGYFSELARLEASNWWFRSRNRVLIWVLKSKVKRFEKYLEVGCGTGYVLEGVRNAFPDAKLCGAEYFEEGLDFARKRIPTASFMRLDITAMSESEAYDVIGAFDVLEHIPDDQLSLRNLSRALKAAGTLVISVPQHRWLWSATDEAACHVRRYTKKELVTKLDHANFDVVYSGSFVSLLVPLMFVSRRFSKSIEKDPLAELKAPYVLNMLLDTVMWVESLIMKLGVRFPFGGSLLVVASKRK